MKKLFKLIRYGRNFQSILDQDKEIKKLNERIQEKDIFITALVKKYGLKTEAKKNLYDRIKESQRKKNMEK